MLQLWQDVIGSSGVLAVVALGLWMSRNGRTQISPHVEEFLTEFWEMLAYFGNTLIFVITGTAAVIEGLCSTAPLLLRLCRRRRMPADGACRR